MIQLLDKLKEEREAVEGQDENKKKSSKKYDESDEEEFWFDEEIDENGTFI